ncbi:hypothetical protein KKC08_00270 [Patescibacteria group bacterium]|nr:hypothetical protein [Patescibacteria group bacterium]MCG2701675.1 hypothetical protein [Candidatus Parcubacteria bacterium]MBU4265390.1 hypothetical protein [Patescibacteria group bacterium]MBU4390342.1 hypothetical protein [Patescibacteria group bacterium]MBU4396589.1 hypothetical protein [Patescibacteria group bacterium]
MKSKFTKAIFFIFLFTFFLSPTLAISSTDDFTPTPTRIQVRQEAQTAIQEKKGILTQVRKNAINRIHNRIRSRIVARYNYLQKFKARIENRILEKEQNGKDMSYAKNKLAEGAQHEESYAVNLEAYEAELDKILNSESPKGLMPQLRQILKDLGDNLRNIRKTLIGATKLLVHL